jgi:hypothetical protein
MAKMTKIEQLQAVFHLYQTEHAHAPTRLRDAVKWGVDKGLLKLQTTDPYDALASKMAQALSQEYDTYKGHRYRLNHARRVKTSSGSQQSFWAVLGHAPDEHIVMSFGQRREHIVGEIAQLKTGSIVRNEMTRGKAEPYRLVTDFSDDMAERGLFD